MLKNTLEERLNQIATTEQAKNIDEIFKKIDPRPFEKILKRFLEIKNMEKTEEWLKEMKSLKLGLKEISEDFLTASKIQPEFDDMMFVHKDIQEKHKQIQKLLSETQEEILLLCGTQEEILLYYMDQKNS